LYAVVRDNLETFYGAADDGAIDAVLPKFVRDELEGFLSCGLLCRGFAKLACPTCPAESHLVAFSCGGRGFCPSCLGRRMCSTAANLVDLVLPREAPVRQWVVTFPFAWRKRLGYDAELLGALGSLFVKTVLGFYAERLAKAGAPGGQSGAVAVVQRTSSDLKLAPHYHVLYVDGVFRADGEEIAFHALPHLGNRDVAEVLERTITRMTRYLERRGLLAENDEGGRDLTDDPTKANDTVAASAVSGATPPSGPEIRRGNVLPRPLGPLVFDKPLCVAKDGFTLHAATRAGAADAKGKEALVQYVLRPPIAEKHVQRGPDGLVRVVLKRPYSDGTTAIDMDPLSLISRLAASVPAPRRHTVKYAGILAPAAKLRSRVIPPPPEPAPTPEASDAEVAGAAGAGGGEGGANDGDGQASDDTASSKKKKRSTYRSFAELLRRNFHIEISCPSCHAPMKLRALVTDPRSVARYLRAIGEPTDLPSRAPARGPPYWKSRVMRRRAGFEDTDTHSAA
jgi:hypothetical protein